MKYILLTIAFLGNSFAFSQTNSRFLNLELLGNSRHLSVNFDSRFNKKVSGLGYQVGVGGTISHYLHSKATINLPIGINYLIGKEKHFAVLGLMGVPEYIIGSSWFSDYYFKANANLGYRYISSKGLLLQAVWTPRLYSSDVIFDKGNTPLWFGLGAGIKL